MIVHWFLALIAVTNPDAKLIVRWRARRMVSTLTPDNHQKDNLSRSDIFWALQG